MGGRLPPFFVAELQKVEKMARVQSLRLGEDIFWSFVTSNSSTSSCVGFKKKCRLVTCKEKSTSKTTVTLNPVWGQTLRHDMCCFINHHLTSGLDSMTFKYMSEKHSKSQKRGQTAKLSGDYIYLSRWWFQMFFIYHPYLGKWSQLTNIFQMGWNHHLVI